MTQLNSRGACTPVVEDAGHVQEHGEHHEGASPSVQVATDPNVTDVCRLLMSFQAAVASGR